MITIIGPTAMISPRWGYGPAWIKPFEKPEFWQDGKLISACHVIVFYSRTTKNVDEVVIGRGSGADETGMNFTSFLDPAPSAGDSAIVEWARI